MADVALWLGPYMSISSQNDICAMNIWTSKTEIKLRFWSDAEMHSKEDCRHLSSVDMVLRSFFGDIFEVGSKRDMSGEIFQNSQDFHWLHLQ